jgi:hypothetical protein
MVKAKTGRQNFYKELAKYYHTLGYYQQSLGVEYMTTKQIDEYLIKQKSKSSRRQEELEIIHQDIVKVYPRILYIYKFIKPMKVIYEPDVLETMTLK